MKTPKNVNVELLKNGSIRMSLVENVTNYPVKEQLRKLPIEQKDLLACYAMLQTNKDGVDAITDAVNHNEPLPWPMEKVKFNKNETQNPIRYFEDVVYNLNYYKNQITTIIQDYDNGFEVQQSAVV
jgi:hypothetical protein